MGGKGDKIKSRHKFSSSGIMKKLILKIIVFDILNCHIIDENYIINDLYILKQNHKTKS